MNQQQNTRKIFPSLAREPNVRAPTHTKASGDSNEKRRNRSKSKNNKVPKSVRYDLENALVSLCDVWFEEIKPYLVRNNIKVHVHGADAAGDRGSVPAASNCSHLDPASSASECDLCRLLFNAANSIESAVSQAASAPAGNGTFNAGILSLISKKKLQSQCYNKENSEPKSRRLRKRSRRHANDSQPSAPPALNLPQRNLTTKVQETRNKTSISNKNYFTQPATKPKMKNKFTQTEKLPPLEAKTKRIPKSCLKGFERRDGTTTLIPVQKEEKNKAQNKIPPLFPNDLIEIIAEKNDKRLQVLFQSPVLSPCSSIMNLLPSPKVVRATSPQKKPWR